MEPSPRPGRQTEVRFTRLVSLLVVMLVTAGCADPGGAGSPSAGMPWGRSFLSTSVIEDGRPRELVPGTRIRLVFADGRLQAQAGCNHLVGPVADDAGQLVVTDLEVTEMGCDQARHDQDAWLAALLVDRPRWTLEGDELVLRTGTTELRLVDREVADPDRPLAGTRWVVDSLIDGETVSSVPAGHEAHLVFDGDRFEGWTGCDQVSGTAVQIPGGLRFGDVTRPGARCDGTAAALESAVLAVLDGDVTARIEADLLTLTHPSGRGLQLRAG